MSKKSVTASDLVSRIERAPNMSRLIDAYDAALGGSDVSCHRYRGQWQVWHGECSGFCGDFSQVRAHLAEKAEEILERAAEAAAQVAPKPAMVEQPCQQQQACAARQPRLLGYELTKRWLDEEGALREDVWPVLFGKPEEAAPLRDRLLAGQGDPTFFGPDDRKCGAYLDIEAVYL